MAGSLILYYGKELFKVFAFMLYTLCADIMYNKLNLGYGLERENKMAEIYEQKEEFNESVFPIKDEGGNLDMYGVWIKNAPKPENEEISLATETDLESLETIGETIAETTPIDESPIEPVVLELEEESPEQIEKETEELDMEIEDFESLDLDDFLSDDSPKVESASTDNNISETTSLKESDFETVDFSMDDLLPEKQEEVVESEPIKLDLEFDEDFVEEKKTEAKELDASFDDMLDELTGVSPSSSNSDFEEVSLDDFASEPVEDPSISQEPEPIQVNENTTASMTELNLDDEPVVEEEKKEEISTADFEEISLDDFAGFADESAEGLDLNTNIVSAPAEDIPLDINVDDDSDISSFGALNIGETEEIEDISLNLNTEEPLSVETELTENLDNLQAEESEVNINNEFEENLEITSEPEINTDSDFETGFEEAGVNISEENLEENTVFEEPSPEDVFFDDVSAVTEDLLSDNTSINTNAGFSDVSIDDNLDLTSEVKNDKSTELLLQISNEISSLKSEITGLKSELHNQSEKLEKLKTTGIINSEEQNIQEDEGSGFFTDDDTDETIALTGDELNNILITADFTEETESEEYEVPEVLNLEDTINESPVITEADPNLETTPEITIEPEPITTIDDDMSYLDSDDTSALEHDEEKLMEEESEIDIPDLKDFNTEMDFISKESEPEPTFFDNETETLSSEDLEGIASEIPVMDLSVESVDEEVAQTAEEAITRVSTPEIPTNRDDKIPLELKEEIKSVLAYMDQLLESLPENKIEEFAKSEYFDTYKKLFEELGIS